MRNDHRSARTTAASKARVGTAYGGVTVTVDDVRLSNPVAEAVMVYVPVVVGVPTLASSDRGRFWCSVTLAGVIVTMPAGVPVTAKLTVMSALGESHSKPQPGVFVPTARACGALRVVREVGRSKQQSEWTKRKVGVTTSRSSVLLAQPVAVAVILAGEPGAVGERPEAGNATWVDPARTLMDPGTASLVGAELARLTVIPPAGTGSEKITK